MSNTEALTSFGEPLHVSISRGTERFKSIQRQLSKQLTVPDEEQAAGAFDLSEWLTSKKQKEVDHLFANRVGLVFNDLDIFGDNIANRHIASLITPFYKLAKSSIRGFGLLNLLSRDREHKHIIHNMCGLVEDGEMLLSPGPSGLWLLDPAASLNPIRGEVAYNQEDDVHFPTLTVRKTLEFAIKCKTPSKKMLAKPESYQDEFLDALLDMYGLKPCADTIVGNAFLRGVSGGERKRVSIAEQIASGASVNVWDGSTRGLDSSSALDYIRSLRIGSDLLHKSTVVTIYQASENIYNLFDKVMVIDEGRQLYFGPADKAVQYFESIGIKKPPRQTTSDFLTGVTQTNERKLMPGFENKAPTTAEDFEHLWLASKERAELQSQISAFEQRLEEDDRGNEIRQLANRIKMGTEKSKMRKRSPYTTTFIYQLNHCMRREWGIFLGNRAAIYFKLIYNVAFAIIIGTLFIRLPQSTAGAFSRGGALFFSLLFTTLTAQSEIPKAVSGREVVYKHKALAMYHPGALSLAQTLVDLPAMERTGGHYLAAIVTLLIGSLCLTAFFRLIGNVAPYVDFGHTMSGIALLYMTLYVGYLIPPTKMHRYMVWAYWANPLAYSFKALLSNEFKDRMMRCSDRDLIPNGPGFTNIANQVCALKGSIPGQRYVSGRRYIEDATATPAYSINVYKRYPPRVDALQDVNERVALAATEFGDVDSELGPTDDQLLKGTTYTWKHVSYTVPVSGGERMLLDDVSGYVKPGTMTALMGSSGAGKTTLLDALSQRKTIGKLEGDLLMNGAPQPGSFRRITGYAEQLDVHNPHATVREALRDTPEEDRLQAGEGISLEERKRLTIGIELVARPKILFLDEPTSGLDAQASYTIVQFLRRLAAEGQTILCTIHQPSATLFEQFDRLLLLMRGGHTVYFGDIGPDAHTLINYFEKNGAPRCPPSANPAEYILDAAGSGGEAIKWPQVWNASPERKAAIEEIDHINNVRQNAPGFNDIAEADNSKYARTIPYQIQLVTCRMFRSNWRDLKYNLVRFALQALSALTLGFSFIRTGNGVQDTQNKVFALFDSAVQPQFLRQRQYYGRESSSNQYGWEAFSFAIIFSEWPFAMVANTLFFVCFYWLVGLNSSGQRTIYFYLMYQLLGIFSLTIGQAIAAFSPNDVIASMINPIFTAMMTLTCGFYRSWLYRLSPYLYFIEGTISNDIYNTPIRFVSSFRGYIDNPGDTSRCSFCPYRNGQQYYSQSSWRYHNRWRNFLILLGFTCFNIVFTVFMVRIYKVNKR
ncbi:hypothetical protein DL89DRAFT_292148 [Linderina pennispora]|uniref:ABC transporter domain-containing protein n=1 Tax=Linderina pennispora TaxID=61395 RepID=A0A1Y1WBE6_9FUNG|nr:uncharacterized protein DL89DRAFT_292148 [Linderina pennispora]ORX70474.1 hypothetical protein DL89DRAFT_292148 [Linderina pennispora]